MRSLAVVVCSLTFSVGDAAAAVVRVAVERREDILSGREFGLVGAYEKLVGKVFFAVDPKNPANRIITDVEKAPTNEDGLVEFSAEFYMLKPKRVARGNGALLLEVGNRGRKGVLSFFNMAVGSLDPSTEAHFGDGLLQRAGFTLLWVGWQWDTPKEDGLMRMYPPIATEDGRPIRGLVRSDFVPTRPETDHSLSDRNHIAYPVADPNALENMLTFRHAVEAERQIIPRSKWKFARVENGEVVADPNRVYLEGGFEPGAIYEVVYVSENPPLVGLGPAGIRDMVSYLKYGSPVELSIPAETFDRALAFGISQSGRFLRTFLYYGFNEDEFHRRVFDGVISHVAGGGRGSFNHRFAQASRDAHPFMNMFYPTDIFPFTDVEQIDPDTGVGDGLLLLQKRKFLPKIFYTNSSYEYWGRAASLIHTTVDGAEDAPMLENVRIYHFAGTQHGPAGFPPTRTIGQQLSNPMDFRWSMRALLQSLDLWVQEGMAPPPSQYGRIDDRTLVPPEKLDFPKLPNVGTTTRVHKAYRADYGREFRSQGIMTKEPPEIGPPYSMMVPAVDQDGNEIAGIQLPEHAVALATYTGWNLFRAGSRPTHELSSMAGSYIPFPRTKAERDASKDPRLSIEERYPSREHYLGQAANAALELVEQGYLLDEDVPEILEQVHRHWDYLMGASTTTRRDR